MRNHLNGFTALTDLSPRGGKMALSTSRGSRRSPNMLLKGHVIDP